MTTLTTVSEFSPYLGGGSIGNLMPPSSIHAGWGWGCGWLGPPLFSVFADTQSGAGGREGTALTYDNLYLFTSYAQCSQEFSSLTLVLIHTYSRIAGSLFEGQSSSSSSLLLPFSRVRFLQPTNISYATCIKHTIKPSYKINPTIFPIWGGRGIIFDMPNHNK